MSESRRTSYGIMAPEITMATDALEIRMARLEGAYEQIMKWWGEHSAAGRIVGGEELKPTSTATTIRR